MANVKVGAKQTNKQTNRLGKNNMPSIIDFMGRVGAGRIKSMTCITCKLKHNWFIHDNMVLKEWMHHLNLLTGGRPFFIWSMHTYVHMEKYRKYRHHNQRAAVASLWPGSYRDPLTWVNSHYWENIQMYYIYPFAFKDPCLVSSSFLSERG